MFHIEFLDIYMIYFHPTFHAPSSKDSLLWNPNTITDFARSCCSTLYKRMSLTKLAYFRRSIITVSGAHSMWNKWFYHLRSSYDRYFGIWM